MRVLEEILQKTQFLLKHSMCCPVDIATLELAHGIQADFNLQKQQIHRATNPRNPGTQI